MKALSSLLAIIGIFFLLFGIAFLTINEPNAEIEQSFFVCFFGGMVSIVFFLVTVNLTERNN